MDVLGSLRGLLTEPAPKHPKCKLIYYEMQGDYDCTYPSHVLSCDECKYGGGRKDPEAKCNRL